MNTTLFQSEYSCRLTDHVTPGKLPTASQGYPRAAVLKEPVVRYRGRISIDPVGAFPMWTADRRSESTGI